MERGIEWDSSGDVLKLADNEIECLLSKFEDNTNLSGVADISGVRL